MWKTGLLTSAPVHNDRPSWKRSARLGRPLILKHMHWIEKGLFCQMLCTRIEKADPVYYCQFVVDACLLASRVLSGGAMQTHVPRLNHPRHRKIVFFPFSLLNTRQVLKSMLFENGQLRFDFYQRVSLEECWQQNERIYRREKVFWLTTGHGK